jgi:glycosyltransferase involved in cell wall biosynthesis
LNKRTHSSSVGCMEMRQEMAPLLSVCIPTYNRSKLLRLGLQSLVPQVVEANASRGLVELIVSDNGSSDDTEQVVQWARQYGPIRYHRNSANTGFAGNLLTLTNELATGEYCWVIGDDDMVVSGALPHLLRAIQSNSECDAFFINHFVKPVTERNRLIEECGSSYEALPHECVCPDQTESRVAKWEDLLVADVGYPAQNMYTANTAIVSHLFRRSLWRSHSNSLQLEDGDWPQSFDATFPHIKVLAEGLIGRPVVYVGKPCILLGMGSQDWSDRSVWIFYTHIPYALRLYASLGVDAEVIGHCRRQLLRRTGSDIARMLTRDPVAWAARRPMGAVLWSESRDPRSLAAVIGGFLASVNYRRPSARGVARRFLGRGPHLPSAGNMVNRPGSGT